MRLVFAASCAHARLQYGCTLFPFLSFGFCRHCYKTQIRRREQSRSKQELLFTLHKESDFPLLLGFRARTAHVFEQ